MGQTEAISHRGEQPVGELVMFAGARRPAREPIVGSEVSLTPLNPAADADPLYRLSHPPEGDVRIWTYLPDGPYADAGAYRAWLEAASQSSDPLFFSVMVGGRPQGVVSYLAIVPEHGTIEIGNIWFGPALARTRAATETVYLLARHAFDDLGYRRLEWKCNALNAPSRRAAERFGFRYEGTFLAHRVIKGRNRDTAWFAVTEPDWPEIRRGFEAWLDPENFTSAHRQRRSLVQARGASTQGDGHV
jgi:RimJ/RimL family protein N-acetyltransferase